MKPFLNAKSHKGKCGCIVSVYRIKPDLILDIEIARVKDSDRLHYYVPLYPSNENACCRYGDI